MRQPTVRRPVLPLLKTPPLRKAERRPRTRLPSKGILHIETAEQVGTLVFGPVLFAFMAWLMRHPAVPYLDRLYFASREGWMMERLYTAMREQAGLHDKTGITALPPATYLPCSRRAALGAQFGAASARGETPDFSLLTSSSRWFEGSVEALLHARIGFVPARPPALQARSIALMRDAAIVQCVADLLTDEIVPHVRRAHMGFMAYAGQCGLLDAGRAGLVDVGYSATMQSAIQNILGLGLTGFYMATTDAAGKVGDAAGYAFAAFAEGAEADGFSAVFGLLLEAVLTAPHGQVTGYDAPKRRRKRRSEPVCEPLFATGGTAQHGFAVIERIHSGITGYCLNRLATEGLQPEKDPFLLLRKLSQGSVTLAASIRQVLCVEDAFCGNGEIDVLGRIAAGHQS